MNVARFPAIGAIEFSVGAHANPFEPLAIATIAVAGALPLLFVALHAQGRGFHRFLTVAPCTWKIPGSANNPDANSSKRL